MPSLLRRKERTPAEEAARQSEILTQIEHQRETERARQRDLMYENARRRQTLWEQQEQAREDRRMAAAAKVLAERHDKEARQKEQQAAVNAANTEAYKAAKAEVENLDAAIRQLGGQHDLSTPEAALAAGEQQAQLAALRQLREKADGRLMQAERRIGRHRLGGQ